MDPLPTSERVLLNQWAASVNVEFFTMDELEARGLKRLVNPDQKRGKRSLT